MANEPYKCQVLKSGAGAEGFEPRYKTIEEVEVCSETGQAAEKIILPDDSKDTLQRVCVFDQKFLGELSAKHSQELPKELGAFSRASNIRDNNQFIDAQASTNNFEEYEKICRSKESRPGIGYTLFAQGKRGEERKRADLPLRPQADIDYRSVDKIPAVVECENCPPVTDDFFTPVFEPFFYTDPQNNKRVEVQFFRPGEYEQKKKEAEAVIKDNHASKDKREWAKKVLKMEPLPEDPKKAAGLLQRLQSVPELFVSYQYGKNLEVSGSGDAKQQVVEIPLHLGRSEDNKRIWVFGVDKFLDKSCPSNKEALYNTLRGVDLRDAEIRRLIHLFKLAKFLGDNDHCMDGGSLAVTKGISVEAVDGLLKELILQPGIFSRDRAPIIAEALQKAFEKERVAGNSVLWNRLAVTSSLVIGALSIYFIRKMVGTQKIMVAMQKKMMGDEIDPKTLYKDQTEMAKAPDFSKIDVGPEEKSVMDRIEEATSKKGQKHVLFSAEGGWGKDVVTDEVKSRAASGEIHHLKGHRIITINLVDLEAAGAKYAGLPAKALKAALDIGYNEPVLYHIQEIHLITQIGVSEGHPYGLSEMLKEAMTDPRFKGIIIATTDQPEALLTKRGPHGERVVDQAQARRWNSIEAPPTTLERVMRIMKKNLSKFLGDNNEIVVEKRALETIAQAAKLRDGSQGAVASEVLDELVARCKKRKLGTINFDLVGKLVSEEKGVSPERAQQILSFLLENPELNQEQARRALDFVKAGESPTLVLDLIEVERQEEASKQAEQIERLKERAASIRRNGGRGTPPPTAPTEGGGGPPPSTTGGSGGAAPAGGRGASASGPVAGTNPTGGTSNRTRLVEEKAPRARGVFEHVGGAAPLFGLFAGAATLKQNGLMSENQEGLFNSIVFGIFAYSSPVALVGGAAGGWAGHAGGSELAKKGNLRSRLPEWLPAEEIVGIGGGLLGFVANEKFNHRFAWYRNISEAGRLGMRHTVRAAMTRIGITPEVIDIKEGLAQTARNVSTGLRIAGQQAAQTARQAAAATQTAWQAGASMARQAAPVIRQAAQQVRNVTANAAPGAFMMGPAVAVFKGGAAVSGAAAAAAAGTALLAGGILAAGAGGAYYAVKSKTGEFWGDEIHNTWAGRKIASLIYGI